MRIAALLCSLLLFQSYISAAPSRVWWPAWRVTSSEDLEYNSQDNVKYRSYPLLRMFDGNRETAWVYSAKNERADNTVFKGKPAVLLTPRSPVTLDALRIMNGQNLSAARFKANHRVIKLLITQRLQNGKTINTVANLADSMGWHTVLLPRHTIKALQIEFTSVMRSKNRGADICISELELRNQGKRVDWNMPALCMFSPVVEGCETLFLINHRGEKIAYSAADIGVVDYWSTDDRYVCGGSVFGTKNDVLWIADARNGRIIHRITSSPRTGSIKFNNKNSVTVDFALRGKKHHMILKVLDFHD